MNAGCDQNFCSSQSTCNGRKLSVSGILRIPFGPSGLCSMDIPKLLNPAAEIAPPYPCGQTGPCTKIPPGLTLDFQTEIKPACRPTTSRTANLSSPYRHYVNEDFEKLFSELARIAAHYLREPSTLLYPNRRQQKPTSLHRICTCYSVMSQNHN